MFCAVCKRSFPKFIIRQKSVFSIFFIDDALCVFGCLGVAFAPVEIIAGNGVFCECACADACGCLYSICIMVRLSGAHYNLFSSRNGTCCHCDIDFGEKSCCCSFGGMSFGPACIGVGVHQVYCSLVSVIPGKETDYFCIHLFYG